MNSIKDAITRVSKSVRLLESQKQVRNEAPRRICDEILPKSKIITKADKNLKKDEFKKFRPLASGHQRRMFQEFLMPLNIPNLKVFEQDRPKYDEEAAKKRWLRKHSEVPSEAFSTFLEDRVLFDRMMELLIELTPTHLRPGNHLDNEHAIHRILQQQRDEDQRNKYVETTPRYHFHEIPPMTELTPESFKKYIYFLTHLKILYKNSLSLQSGIVSNILLHTHKLTNEKYKPFRSIHTYNYLIKYFGFDKNQNAFARELLLVLNKDGHKPNIDTINYLMQLCQTHSSIRSLSSTYQVVIKYLNLSKSFNIEVNLTTWSRVYDLIKNIFLKELFINKMLSINLPILYNMATRIIDDYLATTKDTMELINFIENDLHLDWRNDTKIANKILKHKAKHIQPPHLADLWNFFYSLNLTEFSVKDLLAGLGQNRHLSDPEILFVSVYALFDGSFYRNPDVYKKVLEVLCKNNSQYDYGKIAFLIRGVIHDMTLHLNLPIEVNHYTSASTSTASTASTSTASTASTSTASTAPTSTATFKAFETSTPTPNRSKSSNTPFTTSSSTSPSYSLPENYKIIQRLVGPNLLHFEAKLAYINKNLSLSLLLLRPLDANERRLWLGLKHSIQAANCPLQTEQFLSLWPLPKSSITFSTNHIANYIANYVRSQNRAIAAARDRDCLYKLHLGPDAYTVGEMIQRGILPT